MAEQTQEQTQPETTEKTSLGMQPNLEALLCYAFGFITGIIFYVLEKDNKFVRFHAMQSVVTFGGLCILQIVLGFIPVVGWALIPVVSLAGVVLWIILMVKAYQGEKFSLPFAGEIAEKNS